jgi:hypothetical protein
VVERLVEQEMDSLLIRVLKANAPARRFYEALGGQLVPEVEEQIEDGGAVLEQVAYGSATPPLKRGACDEYVPMLTSPLPL